MLILTHRRNESSVLYDENWQVLARVVSLGSNHNQFRIGFEAPQGVKILREKLAIEQGLPLEPAL